MIFKVLFTLAGVVGGVFAAYAVTCFGFEMTGTFDIALFTILGSLITVSIFTPIGWAVGKVITVLLTQICPNSQKYVEEDTPIITLKDGNGRVSGSGGFLLMTISQNPEYVFYEKNEDGSFEQKRILTEGIKVFERDDLKGAFIRRSYDIATSIWFDTCKHSEQFHVPTGTVIQEYRLDAE